MSILASPESSPPDLVDDAIGAYVRWREECAAAREAYSLWTSAARTDRMLASYAYAAALDREETAAGAYAAAMRQLEAECLDAATPDHTRLGCEPINRKRE